MGLYFLNIGFAIIRVVSIAFLIKVAAAGLTAEALGIFLLLRRYSAVGGNFFQLGFSQSIMRYVPEAESNENSSLQYLISPIIILAILGVCVYIVLMCFGQDVGSTIFSGKGDPYKLIMVLFFVSWVSALDLLVRAFFLAKRQVFLANVIEVLGGALLLALLLLYFQDMNVVDLLLLHAFLQLVVLMVLVFFQYFSFFWKRSREARRPIFNTSSELLETFKYGAPRGAAAMLEMLLIAICAWGVSQYNLNAASGFLISMILIRVVQAGVTPLAQLITVTTASNIRNEDKKGFEKEFYVVGSSTLMVLLFSCGLLVPWSEDVVNVFFGNSEFSSWASQSFPILLFSIVPYGIYQFLKGVVDVRIGIPVNFISLALVNLLVGFYSFYAASKGDESLIAMSLLLFFSYLFIMLVAVACSWHVVVRMLREMCIIRVIVSTFLVFITSYLFYLFVESGSIPVFLLSICSFISFGFVSYKIPLVSLFIKLLLRKFCNIYES